MKLSGGFLVLLALGTLPGTGRAQGLNTARLDEVFGRPGEKIGQVYKVGFPRTDLHVIVAGIPIRPGLALGSWAAFSGTDEDAMVMGDLVLVGGEVDPVMKALGSSGFAITALHNHLLGESPRLLYMHYMGRGQAEELARGLRAALARSATPLGKPAAAQPTTEPAFVKTVEQALGRKGRFVGGVLAFGVPRAEPVTLAGATLVPAEGIAESINFQQAGAGRVAATGDFVLAAAEVNPVITALTQHGIRVTALHSHMLEEQPRLFFLHFWGVGRPGVVAAGIESALRHVAVK
jgi:Domain of Unknown Function (DUF1259)